MNILWEWISKEGGYVTTFWYDSEGGYVRPSEGWYVRPFEHGYVRPFEGRYVCFNCFDKVSSDNYVNILKLQ